MTHFGVCTPPSGRKKNKQKIEKKKKNASQTCKRTSKPVFFGSCVILQTHVRSVSVELPLDLSLSVHVKSVAALLLCLSAFGQKLDFVAELLHKNNSANKKRGMYDYHDIINHPFTAWKAWHCRSYWKRKIKLIIWDKKFGFLAWAFNYWGTGEEGPNLGFRKSNVVFALDVEQWTSSAPSVGSTRVGVCPTSPHVFCGSGEGIRPRPLGSPVVLWGVGPSYSGCSLPVWPELEFGPHRWR